MLTNSATGLLLDKGYSEEFGAREMKRTFERWIAEPIGRMILEGQVEAGQIVKVRASGDTLRYHVTFSEQQGR